MLTLEVQESVPQCGYTMAEVRERLASKIMGWRISVQHAYIDGNGKVCCNYKDWMPERKRDQAFMVAHNIGGLQLFKNLDCKGCEPEWSANFGSNPNTLRHGSTTEFAIFYAALASIPVETR